MKQNGFTFIELLITSVIFATVAVIAVGTLSSTVHLQAVHKISQNVNLQGSRGLTEISQDVEQAQSLQTVVLKDTHTAFSRQTSNFPNYPDDDLLIVSVGQSDGKGGVTSILERHVYCAEIQFDTTNHPIGKLLTRYIVPIGNSINPNVSPYRCTPNFIQDYFRLSGVPVSYYLTDNNLQIVNLRFWPTWLSNSTDYSQNYPSVRIELTVQYYPNNVASSIEQRASNALTQSAQIVTRTIATKQSAFIHSGD